MKRPYEVALVVELGTAEELVLGPFGQSSDWPENGEQDICADEEE